MANADQTDTDQDGTGDACDNDDDGDGRVRQLCQICVATRMGLWMAPNSQKWLLVETCRAPVTLFTEHHHMNDNS